MPELPDVIPGAVIEAGWTSDVKNRTLMRYSTLTELEGSVPIPDPGSFGYVTTYPWPVTILNTPGDGNPFVWANDTGAGGSPFPAGYRWTSLLTDRGGFVFGPLAFRGSLDTDAVLWSMDVPGAESFRLRLLNAPDGESGVSMMQLVGTNGGVNYLRRPLNGRFQVQDRTGSVWQFGSGRFQDGSGTDLDGAALFPNAHTDDTNHVMPLVFTEGDSTLGTAYGMYMTDTGLIPVMVLARLDSASESVLAVPGIVSSSSENWRVGSASVNTPGGATAYRLERQGSSSARFKDIEPEPAGELGALAELGALEAVRFTYSPGYLAEGDEREGVPIWGVVAEQLHEVNPSLADHDAEGRPKGVQWEQLTALLIAGYQNLRDRVAALEVTT